MFRPARPSASVMGLVALFVLLVPVSTVRAHDVGHKSSPPESEDAHHPADVEPTLLQRVEPLPVDGAKPMSRALRTIRAAKERGEYYPGMTWHAVEAEYLARQERARGALRVQLQDGGGASSQATPILGSPFVDDGTTVGKGNDIALGSCNSSGDDTAEDAWYRLDLNTPASLTAWITCASANGLVGFDTRLGVFDSNLLLLSCNDDSPLCAQPDYQSRIEDLQLDPGTYYVVVDGYNGNSGPYRLNVEWVETVDPCVGSDETSAAVVATLPFVESASTVDACDDVLVDCELATGDSGPDRWYRVSFAEAVLLDVRTTCDDLDLDSRIAVLDAGLNSLYCNDDDPLCVSQQSRIEDALLAPGDYFVVVDSPAGLGGSFTVEMDTTHAPPSQPVELLPDIVVVANDLYDNVIDTSVVPGRTHLRLSNATANLGMGKLYLYGVAPEIPTPTHEVRQRIWRDNGSWYDRSAGQFVYHPGHNHIHIEGWAQYNLREILPGDGVGPIVASGTKTSFCIIDLRVEDSSLPGFPPGGLFLGCGSTVQGLSVGWADIYDKGLADQWIDVTDVADGQYWLESVVDPVDNILEADETNNVARIQVTIGAPLPINPDRFEPGDSITAVEARPVGGNNSPNLGPCDPLLVLGDLTVHESGNDDYYRFYLPAFGGADDFLRIDFVHAQGDLDLDLLDATGAFAERSNGTTDAEVVSLEGRPAGWYYARVFGYGGATHPSYQLTIDPSSNASPAVSVIDPPLGDVQIFGSIENYAVHWSAADPDSNAMWASVWVNDVPAFDGDEIFLETSKNTPAASGLYVLSTTYLPLGTWWVHVEVTDGGSRTGAWSDGTFTLVQQPTSAPAPLRTQLLANVPNPFNPVTELRLELARPTDLRWAIYDARGALVRQIDAGLLPAGTHARRWDGTDEAGSPVSSGVYLAVIRGEGVDLSRKLTLIK